MKVFQFIACVVAGAFMLVAAIINGSHDDPTHIAKAFLNAVSAVTFTALAGANLYRYWAGKS